jgi:GDP-L-fucose synthase
MDKQNNIVVFGSSGLVGSAIARNLAIKGYKNIYTPSRKTVNLLNKPEICAYLSENDVGYVFLAAAKVGGIAANMKEPASFGLENGLINLNVIDCCYLTKVKKLLFLGSSCIYPKNCPQPMKEEYLLEGKCEPTNEMYALSKIYGLKLCEAYNKQYGCNFISCQPSNIYGIGDHFDSENSHVVSALISKFHKAKINNDPFITLWGTGSAMRELLYVEDCADACISLMENYNNPQFINIGTGIDISIRDLANMIKGIVGYQGLIQWDSSKPDGMYRKILDVSRIHEFGWKHKTNLQEGLQKTYEWYLGNKK